METQAVSTLGPSLTRRFSFEGLACCFNRSHTHCRTRIFPLCTSPRCPSAPARVVSFGLSSDDNPLAPLKSTWSQYEFAAYNAFGRLFYIIALGGMCTSAGVGSCFDSDRDSFCSPDKQTSPVVHCALTRMPFYQSDDLNLTHTHMGTHAAPCPLSVLSVLSVWGGTMKFWHVLDLHARGDHVLTLPPVPFSISGVQVP